MKRFITCACVVFCLGCSGNHPTQTEQGAIAGGAIGAGTGAVVGHSAGSTGAGAAIGAVGGAVAGAVVAGSDDETYENKIKQQQEIIRRQQLEIQRQNKEILDLKRQQLMNDSFRRYEDK